MPYCASAGTNTEAPEPPESLACSLADASERPAPLTGMDPLYAEQWHLHNTGQNAYSRVTGTPGMDLGLSGLTQTGRSVSVNVIDSGLDLDHPDLATNIDRANTVNLDGGGCPENGFHGTSVAGIIAAVANNNIGGRGVAPNATLHAYNYLEHQTFSNFARSVLAESDIANMGFGYIETVADFLPSSVEVDALRNAVTEGRGGKGRILIRSVNNEYQYCAKSLCAPCGRLAWAERSCYNVNMDPRDSLPYTMPVAALNGHGVRASYSSTGSAILVSSYAGDGTSPRIITTDQAGCEQGYSSSIPRSIDPNCDYTNTFTGTSAAAPMVSGVVALMLEANPNLSWRDVRHILVHVLLDLWIQQLRAGALRSCFPIGGLMLQETAMARILAYVFITGMAMAQ